MVALRRAAAGLCRLAAAYLQANVAAAVLQVVLVAAAFVAGQRWQSGEGLTELRFPALYPARCSYGGAIDG